MNVIFQPLRDLRLRGEAWFIDAPNALRGLAMARILVAIAALGILIANFGQRHALWGVSSNWVQPHRADGNFASLATLFADTNPLIFTIKYLLVGALAIAVLLGWRTRLTTLLLVIGFTALVERNGLLGNQGDNIARIGLLFMVFMNTSAHWSLDQRRRDKYGHQARTLWDRWALGMPLLPNWMRIPLHNAALMALALQIFILYTASAMYKVQGQYWQDGTALYLPVSLPDYAVFPSLNQALMANGVFVGLATYFAVYIQLFFAVGLLHPVSRRISIIGVILMHVGIAVLMGLPWFSLSMIAFDAIFISTLTYKRAENWVRERGRGMANPKQGAQARWGAHKRGGAKESGSAGSTMRRPALRSGRD